jgi:hypothetical protein
MDQIFLITILKAYFWRQLQCCGIKSLKEWRALEPKFKFSLGNLCTDENVDLGSHKDTVCHTPYSCWGSARDNHSHYNHRHVYEEGCLSNENNVAFGVLGMVASIEILFFFVVVSS